MDSNNPNTTTALQTRTREDLNRELLNRPDVIALFLWLRRDCGCDTYEKLEAGLRTTLGFTKAMLCNE